ncbi:MAG: BrnT family toxin [Pseudomonadota bacterium]|nr:BrnT family toxin [Pseudomonadota bacterium]
MVDRLGGFDWDGGNRCKCGKHGVSIAEIEAVFRGDPRVAPDVKHSGDETRFIAIDANSAGRPLFVAFTFRWVEGVRLIRPVSARYMHAKEIDRYEASRT